MWANTGICAGPWLQPAVDACDDFLNSRPLPIRAEKNGMKLKTEQTGMVFVEHPPSDLRNLGPFKISKCWQLQSVGDPNIGGIFPHGDGLTFLSLSDRDCTAPNAVLK